MYAERVGREDDGNAGVVVVSAECECMGGICGSGDCLVQTTC